LFVIFRVFYEFLSYLFDPDHLNNFIYQFSLINGRTIKYSPINQEGSKSLLLKSC
jgi:hypothetical protein